MTMNTTEKLPAETNLQILSQLPDFYALENSLEALPQAMEVFSTTIYISPRPFRLPARVKRWT